MGYPGRNWRISKIANQAKREIESLDLETQERIFAKLEGLQENPFSSDVKKIRGKEDIFRLRVGSFRMYFRIVFSSNSIEILLFDKRGSIKNKTLERL